MYATSPPESVHALDVDGLRGKGAAFFVIYDDGIPLGMGAYCLISPDHAELKSMHVLKAQRGRGLSRLMLAHLLDAARSAGATRASLETGSMSEFAPARSLYASAGFEPCAPFADYTDDPNSFYMTRTL